MGPVIASVTLIAPGADRLFLLRRKDGSVAFSERLPHGSLLIMAGDTQKNFRHEIPKEPAMRRRGSPMVQRDMAAGEYWVFRP